jgi:hypothetical protein
MIAAAQFDVLAFVSLGFLGWNLLLIFVSGLVLVFARGESVARRAANSDSGVHLSSDSADKNENPLAPAANTTPAEGRVSHDAQGLAELETLPVVSMQWSARNTLGWLGRDSREVFRVSSDGKVVGIVHKRDLQRAVSAGGGAMAIERLVATGRLHVQIV